MHEVQLRELDLNLLRVFDVIYEERSIARAAARLCLSASAVSHALSRLRILLGDELFVRSTNGMLPTSYAMAIGPRLHESLRQLERSLRPASFDPATSDRRFVVSASPYICTTLLPRLMDRFHREAPDCDLDISRRTATLVSDLDLGQVDIAILRSTLMPKRFAMVPLFSDRWVYVLNRDHPHLAAGDLAGIGDLLQVGIFPRDPVGQEPAGDLAAIRPSRVALTVEDAMSAISVAASSHYVAVVPGRLADAMAGYYPLHIADVPDRPKIRFDIIWHRMHGQEGSLLWLRDMFQSVANSG